MNTSQAAEAPSHLRGTVGAFISSPGVQRLILGLILVNAVILGLETSPDVMDRYGAVLKALDTAILGVFVVEIALRLYVQRLALLRDPWGMFDLAVISVALIPASGPFAVLRALRVLRVLRVLTIVPSMRRVVGALLGAVPGLLSIALVLMLLYYVAAVVATNLFGAAFPEWFGNLGRSVYTLFQVMTLESWSMGISRPVMEQFPYAWAFFIPFILVATFTMLNLFIAVIVNALQTMSDEEQKPGEPQPSADLHTEIRSLQQEVRALRELLQPQPGKNAELPASGSPGRPS